MKWLTTKRILNLEAHARCLVWIFVSFAELVAKILWVGKDNDSLANGSQEWVKKQYNHVDFYVKGFWSIDGSYHPND